MKLIDFLSGPGGLPDAFLFDIDGTLLYGNRPQPGAAKLLALLRRRKIPFFFLTNDGTHTHQEKSTLLNNAGIDAFPEEMISCTDPVSPEFARRGWSDKRFFLIGNPANVPGIRVETNRERLESCDGLLFCGGPHDWHADFTALFNFFRRHPDRLLVVPNQDLFNPLPDGVSLCPFGQMQLVLTLLERIGIQLEPIHFGKPYGSVYDLAMQRFGAGIDRKNVLCVGDLLDSDILGANRAGMVSALVLTGLTTAAQAAAAPDSRRPHHIFEAIG